jgi:hypothetical protein
LKPSLSSSLPSRPSHKEFSLGVITRRQNHDYDEKCCLGH